MNVWFPVLAMRTQIVRTPLDLSTASVNLATRGMVLLVQVSADKNVNFS